MISVEEVQQSLSGAWALMRGKKSGLGSLDLSADGFWDSFWAIPLSVPPLLLSWISIADAIAVSGGGDTNKASLVARLATVDLMNWLLPIMLLALVAGRLGIANRFVHFIVASNWATTIVAWFSLPISLLGFFVPDATEIAQMLSLGLVILSLVMFWRLTQATLDKDVSTTIAVFVGLNVASIVIVILLQSMFGLSVTA